MSETLQLIKWQLKLPEPFADKVEGHCDLLYDRGDFTPLMRVTKLGLDKQFEVAFVKTNPVEYGWFIESPLNPNQIELLIAYAKDLISAEPLNDDGLEDILKVFGLGDDDLPAPKVDKNLEKFISAASLALTANIPFHVELLPPGHFDFGICTTHCHCPRCKTQTPINPWNEPFPSTEVECQTCGNVYIPANTHLSRPNMRAGLRCVQCNQPLSESSFKDEDLLAIQSYQSAQELIAEERTIKSILNVYDEFATAEQKADPNKPSGIVRSVLMATVTDSSTDAHKHALEWLSRCSCYLGARRSSVQEILDQGTSKADVLIFCPIAAAPFFRNASCLRSE